MPARTAAHCASARGRRATSGAGRCRRPAGSTPARSAGWCPARNRASAIARCNRWRRHGRRRSRGSRRRRKTRPPAGRRWSAAVSNGRQRLVVGKERLPPRGPARRYPIAAGDGNVPRGESSRLMPLLQGSAIAGPGPARATPEVDLQRRPQQGRRRQGRSRASTRANGMRRSRCARGGHGLSRRDSATGIHARGVASGRG